MKGLRLSTCFAAGVLAGCMAGSAPLPAQDPAGGSATSASPVGIPLLIDRTDLRIGTTVQFSRIPTVGEIHDLRLLPALAHVVLALPSWPSDVGPLEPLRQLEEGADLIVVLPGYPPSRAAAEAWNTVRSPLRLVVVVPGPPPGAPAVEDLNAMRRLERVIAQMDEPARTGFERLQWPLSFRKLID